MESPYNKWQSGNNCNGPGAGISNERGIKPGFIDG